MVPPLEAGDLRLATESVHAENTLVVTWRGRSGARNPGEILAPYFEQVLSEAERTQMIVEIHFEHLEHFNSSTVAAIIRLVQTARNRAIPLVFVYDQKLKWQKLSFDTMRVFVKSDGLLQINPL